MCSIDDVLRSRHEGKKDRQKLRVIVRFAGKLIHATENSPNQGSSVVDLSSHVKVLGHVPILHFDLIQLTRQKDRRVDGQYQTDRQTVSERLTVNEIKSEYRLSDRRRHEFLICRVIYVCALVNSETLDGWFYCVVC